MTRLAPERPLPAASVPGPVRRPSLLNPSSLRGKARAPILYDERAKRIFLSPKSDLYQQCVVGDCTVRNCSKKKNYCLVGRLVAMTSKRPIGGRMAKIMFSLDGETPNEHTGRQYDIMLSTLRTCKHQTGLCRIPRLPPFLFPSAFPPFLLRSFVANLSKLPFP